MSRAQLKQSHALPETGALVVVTGASGYVGSHLVQKLLSRGHHVRACVRDVNNERKCGFLKQMPEYSSGELTLHSADMTKPGAYDDIFEGPVCVFHPAEVFMSFSSGRDQKQARADFGKKKLKRNSLKNAAFLSSQYVVDSIDKSTTVKRLVYTSSVAAVGPMIYENNFIIDETREPVGFDANSYAVMKRATEHFFSHHGMASGGRWSVIIGNPGDIIGPIMSPHQARETWQGKLASVLEGGEAPQEAAGRPWWTVDVRDVAEAEIQLAMKCKRSSNGQRFLLVSGDRIQPADLGPRINELYPDIKPLKNTVCFMPGMKRLFRRHPQWLKVALDNRKTCTTINYSFYGWDDTLRATVDSLMNIGGIQPPTK